MTSNKMKNSNFKKIQFKTIIDLNNRKSLYKRQLPETCIPLNSKEGKELFSEAFKEKNMECYFMLSIHFLTQSELTYCGISSLCMILNALEVDPMYNWKGQWRFFTEENIRYPPHIDRDIIEMQGITLEQYSEISKYNFLEEVKLCRASEITKEVFIQDIEYVSRQNREVMTLNFARDIIKQTGYGHICPLGGYNKKRGMVLLLDIARHKYPAYWVSLDMLWDAVNTVDSETGESRGYSIVKNPLQLMKNAFIVYYRFKEPIEDLFNCMISNMQDELINNIKEYNNILSFLESTIIQTIEKVNSIKTDLIKLKQSIFMPTYLITNKMVLLRKDYIDTIKELYKEIKSLTLYKYIISKKKEYDLIFDENSVEDPEHPNLDNEISYFVILILYVILPSFYKIMSNLQNSNKEYNCHILMKDLEPYLEEIKNNEVILAESKFFSNSFFPN